MSLHIRQPRKITLDDAVESVVLSLLGEILAQEGLVHRVELGAGDRIGNGRWASPSLALVVREARGS